MLSETANRFERQEPGSVQVSKRFFRENNGRSSEAQQYWEMYKYRLAQVRPVLVQNVKAAWGDITIERRVLDAHENKSDDELVIIGMLYKEMPRKVTPLKEFAKNKNIFGFTEEEDEELDMKCLASEEDHLEIEDEYGSLVLSGDCLEVHKLYSGIPIALRGTLRKEDAVFQVTAYLLPDLPPQKAITSQKSERKGKYIALLSGLNLGISSSNHLSVQMLFDFLNGFLGTSDDHKQSSLVSRIIIAGNVLAQEFPIQGDAAQDFQLEAKLQRKRIQDELNVSLKDCDVLLSELAQSNDIDLMAGHSDPATIFFPQQPFHPCLFPLSNTYSTFHCVSNPYEVTINDVTLLGTSGQPITDMKTYGRCTDMEALELTLRARNVAPTCPDTLSCFPYKEFDPFLMPSCPHVYFAGNCDKFQCKTIEGENGQRVVLICIPSFAETGELVLVDLESITCDVVQFMTDM